MNNSLKKTKGTFLDEASNPPLEKCDAAFFGVEFDYTASYNRGARFGPKAILDATRQIEFEAPFIGMRLDEKIKIHNLGFLSYSKPKGKALEKLSANMVFDAKELAMAALSENKFLFVLGGDHSVSNGHIEALSQKFPHKDVCIVSFDAHFDLRNALEEMPLSHGSISRRIQDAGFNQLFIGVRDTVCTEEINFISQKKIADKIFYCPLLPKQFYTKQKSRPWIKKENLLFGGKTSKKQLAAILSKIKEKNVWFEIDIDVLDANEFPATGTPMPNGLSFTALNELLLEIIFFAKKTGKKVLGFSLVEVSPLLEKNATEYLAEKAVSTACEMKAALLCYNILLFNFIERFKK